jgi:hypothetical protein
VGRTCEYGNELTRLTMSVTLMRNSLTTSLVIFFFPWIHGFAAAENAVHNINFTRTLPLVNISNKLFSSKIELY